MPYLIGLTGNIAAGKSTVDAMLAALGARVIDADHLVHRLLQQGTPVYTAAVAAFGAAILDAQGQIDRARLGRLVFADAEALARLEAIVHPAVGQEIAREVAAASETVVVVDAVKLVESGLADRCDAVWLVTAREEQQLERLVKRRGMAEADARQRLAAQPSLAKKLERADVIIDNSGTLAETAAQVRRAWRQIPRAGGQD